MGFFFFLPDLTILVYMNFFNEDSVTIVSLMDITLSSVVLGINARDARNIRLPRELANLLPSLPCRWRGLVREVHMKVIIPEGNESITQQQPLIPAINKHSPAHAAWGPLSSWLPTADSRMIGNVKQSELVSELTFNFSALQSGHFRLFLLTRHWSESDWEHGLQRLS